MASPKALAVQLLSVLNTDLPRLRKIDRYQRGDHDKPYMPPQADAEYRLIAKRAVSNWIPLLVSTPAQALYVDDFRRPNAEPSLSEAAVGTLQSRRSPEMVHWHGSRLDSRQIAVHRGALTFGHSFVLTEKDKTGKVVSKGLSALKTAALFEDPANDDAPYAVLTVTSWPVGENADGTARMWDQLNEYEVRFKSLEDDKSVRVSGAKKHGYTECPVTRFAAAVDLEGRTVGVVEPMIPLQDRINQTVFDLLVTQTYASFKVRWVTGMAPPLERDAEGNPVLDEQGNPKPLPVNHNAKRFLFAEDPTTSFGTLDETPLDGFINSIEAAIRQLAAISQTPPHHVLGQIANLSAEALLAAENSLARKVEEFRKAFGESWERVFRVAAHLNGETVTDDDALGEVLWRDMEQRSLAQSADALGKLAESLSIPKRGLWNRVPGVTSTEIENWETLADEEPDAAMASALSRSVPVTEEFIE